MKGLKIFRNIVIILLVLIVIVFIARNFIAKEVAQWMIRSQTDLTMDVEKLNIGVFSTKIDIQGLKIYNPQGFQDRVMVDIPRFYVDYNLFSLFSKKYHFSDVIFHLNEFVLVKQADGTTNIDSLKKFAEQEPGKEEEPEADEAEEEVDIQIDSLALKIGSVTIKDYARGTRPSVNTYNVNLEQQYQDISSARQFVTALLLEHMNQFVINAIKNIGLNEIGGLLGDSVDAIGKFGKDAINAVTGVGEGTIGEAGKILENTTEGLKNIIKMPFGR